VYQPSDAALLSAHLAGEVIIALSALGEDGSCKWVCLDCDAADAQPRLLELAGAPAEMGLPGLVEASRRGGTPGSCASAGLGHARPSRAAA
jgi:hypothetical protein